MLALITRATVAASLLAGISVVAVVASPGARPSPTSNVVAAASASPTVPAASGSTAPSAPSGAPGAGDGGDLRSSGEGAGLVGAPLAAIGTVLAIGGVSAIATLAYVRLTSGRGGRPR